MLPQSHTEQILERRLTELGGQLHRAHTVTGLTTTTDGASVTVIGPQGTPASVAARFVSVPMACTASSERPWASIFPGATTRKPSCWPTYG